jgi:hypothetical protein
MNRTSLDPKLKTKANDIQLSPKLIFGVIRTPVLIVSKFSSFRAHLIQLPLV